MSATAASMPNKCTGCVMIPNEMINVVAPAGEWEMLLGHAFGEAILSARRGDEIFAIGAICTHYGGPLAKGLMVNCMVRCPWHHACFDLRTGEAIRAPRGFDAALFCVALAVS